MRGLESNGAIALVFVEPLDEAGNVIGAHTIDRSRGETLELIGVFEALAWPRTPMASASGHTA